MSDDIITRRDGAVLRLILNRPHKKNALTGAMYHSLIAAFAAAARDPGIGAILIEGEGGSFTAGNDIADFLTASASGEAIDRDGFGLDQSKAMNVIDSENRERDAGGKPAAAFPHSALPALEFIRTLARCDIPLVAAVDGIAIGLGTTLLLHCDLVYATPAALFRMNFIDLGLVPEAGASLLVPRRVGLQKASEWLLLGEAFGAEEAKRAGLVNAIVAREDLAELALSRARTLAAKPRAALAATRRLMRGDRGAILARIEEEAQAFATALRSDEARASFAAFLGREKNG